jgi:hypothetical protein
MFQFLFERADHYFEFITVNKQGFGTMLFCFVRAAFESITHIGLGLQNDI